MRRTFISAALALWLVTLVSGVGIAQTTTPGQPTGGASQGVQGATGSGAGQPGSMTGTGTSGMQSEAYGNRDRDGFDVGWLGLVGLAGLLGLRHQRRKHETANATL